MHLFFKVDVVVFCEGGPPKSVDEALALTGDGRTLDTIYWANLVNFTSLPKRYYFKSVGDKGTLLAIASDLTKSGVSTISVCIDSDYDVRLKRIKTTPRLAYTHGYSWESDILHTPVLHRILTHLIGPPPEDMLIELEISVNRLQRDLVAWCEIDIALRARNKPCLFDRDKPLRVVDLTADPPCISHATLRHKLANIGYKRAPRKVVTIEESVVLRVAFGKLISRLFYHLICKFASRLTQRVRLDYDGFMRVAMSETFGLLRSGDLTELAEHMSSQASALV
jgi:hypothetical protein